MSVMVARESERQKIVNDKKVLDHISRERRLERHLDSLEKDNFQEDPHANLIFINKKMLHVEGQEDKSKGTAEKLQNMSRFETSFFYSFFHPYKSLIQRLSINLNCTL